MSERNSFQLSLLEMELIYDKFRAASYISPHEKDLMRRLQDEIQAAYKLKGRVYR